jgi:hypothetical protein
MKLKILFIPILALICSFSSGHSTFFNPGPEDPEIDVNSWDGRPLNPKATYFTLTIYINIIYDHPNCSDPNEAGSGWFDATLEGVFNDPINDPAGVSWPAYVYDFIDVEYDPLNVSGTFTKLYAESSFNNLIVLGDYILVNVKHTSIKPDGSVFDWSELQQTAVDIINAGFNGTGLNTVHGHNSVSYYSTIHPERFDFVMFNIRNASTHYGYYSNGVGAAGGPIEPIKTMEGTFHTSENMTVQGVGSSDLSANPTQLVVHEFSHLFFGGNNMHTGGGHSWTRGGVMCFIDLQFGYGLMGGAASGLVNCNGYDRYRIGWMHADNSLNWPITATNANTSIRDTSDITKSDGNKSFILGNFITTGDVIRIKLPYIESPASNQYIWLENHKILENTLNFLQYQNTHTCRPEAHKGIYAYYQVGKDVLEGPSGIVYPGHDCDNLRFICANGFYDQIFEEEGFLGDCLSPGQKLHLRDTVHNPLSGNNDLSSYYWDKPGIDILQPSMNAKMAHTKKYLNSNDVVTGLPYLMSEINPFHGHSVMSLNTNPAPYNSVTYYHEPYSVDKIKYTEPKDTFRNQPDVFLTGLKIEMIPLANDDYQVDISWDNYDLDSEVRWTGSIVLKEELNLIAGSMLLLDQNLTPNTIYRNETTGLFSAPTLFRCDSGSQMFQEVGSELVIDNMSTLLIDDGSEFFANAGRLEVKNYAYLQIASGGYFEQNQDAEIYADNTGNILIEQGGYYLIDGSDLTIKAGGKFEIESCATLEIINGGRLVIESGAEICIHPGAFFILEPGENLVFNEPFSMGNCLQFSHENFEAEVMATPPTNVINGTVNWDNKIYNFTDNLYIEAEAVLNLSGGSILRFTPGNKVIVRRQGTMNISNSVMTNLCENQFWDGIEVWGNDTMSQLTYPDGKVYQGKLFVSDSSLIENALIGVLAGNMDVYYHDDDPESESSGTPIPISTRFNGGIVQVRSSELRNNRTGIYLAPYENFLPTGSEQIKNNASYIKNCDFRITQEHIPGLEPVAFLRLNGVRGIQSYGNHYINGSELKPEEAGVGVLSLNSNFEVKEHCFDEFTPCQNYRLSRFEDLHFGIKALGASTAKTFTVDTTEFINNSTGLYTSGVNNFTIIRSRFEVDEGSSTSDHTSLYIEDECSGFQIEENVFNGVYAGSPFGTKTSIGVVFNNTRLYNLLYRNHFEKMDVAVHALNSNRGAVDGLCIKCNVFVDNGKDIEVLFETSYTKSGIAPQQGSMAPSPDAPAGNRFSRAGSFQNPGEIYNECQNIDYVYHAQASPELNLEPIYITTGTVETFGNEDAMWNDLSCPSNLTPPGGGHGEEALRGMKAEAEQQADSTQNLINTLKDAGDTETLHWDVSMSAPWQSMEVYTELMSVSPYVSDTVLGAAIEKENVLVDAMIRDVMVANTHSAKSSELMQLLEQRLQPLPDYMVEEILEGRSIISVYEELKSGLLYYNRKNIHYQNQLAQIYLKDALSTTASTDSLVNMYISSGQAGLWYQAAFLRHEQNQVVEATSILNSLPATFNLDPEQLAIHSDIVLLLEQAGTLQGQEKSLIAPDSLTVAWLHNLLDSGTQQASILARNILWAHGIVAHDPVYLLPDENKSQLIKTRLKRNPSPQAHILKLLPNPAKDYVIVDFDFGKLKTVEENGILIVSTIDGKFIETLPLNSSRGQLLYLLNTYKTGTYIFSLYYSNQMLDSKRLIIQ